MARKVGNEGTSIEYPFTLWDRVLLEVKITGMPNNDLTLGEVKDALGLIGKISFSEEQKKNLLIVKDQVTGGVTWPREITDNEYPVELSKAEDVLLRRITAHIRGWPIEERSVRLQELLGL